MSCRVSGNRTYYRGNRSHPLYPEIRSLVLKTSGLADVLRESLGEKAIRLAFVFGSVADSSETSDSDVDLLVIASVSLRELVGRLSGVSQQLGRELNPSVMTEFEFSKRRRAGDHFVSDDRKADAVYLEACRVKSGGPGFLLRHMDGCMDFAGISSD